MKKLLLSTVALLGLAGAAAAADLPLRGAIAPHAPLPAFTWTGFYVGAHAGYLWNDAETTMAGVGGPILPIDVAQGTLTRRASLEQESIIAGAQVGYNMQFGAFVAGVEADISGLDADDSSRYSAVDQFLFPGVLTHSSFRTELEWLATVRARIGLPFERALIYATGGLAVGEVRNTFGVTIPGFYNNSWTGSDTETGWTVGGGIEYALTDNLSLRAEYLHYDLGDRTVRAADDVNFAGQYMDYDFSHRGDLVRGGVNLRF
jgi:outer membrane immunogenic protein